MHSTLPQVCTAVSLFSLLLNLVSVYFTKTFHMQPWQKIFCSVETALCVCLILNIWYVNIRKKKRRSNIIVTILQIMPVLSWIRLHCTGLIGYCLLQNSYWMPVWIWSRRRMWWQGWADPLDRVSELLWWRWCLDMQWHWYLLSLRLWEKIMITCVFWWNTFAKTAQKSITVSKFITNKM